MIVTLNKAILKTITTGFNKIISRKTTAPVLGHLLFACGTDGCLHVTGTNLEETLTVKLSGTLPETDADANGFLLPLDHLKDLAKSVARDAEVCLSLTEDSEHVISSVTVDEQMTSSRIEAVPVDEFPTESRNVIQQATGPLDGFLEAYRRVVTFASTDETRHVLNGVFWDSEDAVLVATDGRRIGCVMPPEFNIPESLIIPRSKFLEKQAMKGEESVDFLVFERNEDSFDFAIAGNSFEYRVRCIDGTYPNHRQVIPDTQANFAGTVSIHPEDIPLVKQAVSRLADDKPDRAIALYADTQSVALIAPSVLTDDTPNNGDLHIRLTNSSFEPGTGNAAACCVNSQFLLDFLNNGFTTFRLSDGFNPWLVEGNGVGAVMPLRIDNTQPILNYADNYLSAVTAENKTAEEVKPEKENSTMEETTADNKPELTIVDSPDPMEEFLGLLTDAQDKLKESTTAVRELRKAGRALERIHKDRERQLNTRERDIQKSLRLFNQLQESLAA